MTLDNLIKETHYGYSSLPCNSRRHWQDWIDSRLIRISPSLIFWPGNDLTNSSLLPIELPSLLVPIQDYSYNLTREENLLCIRSIHFYKLWYKVNDPPKSTQKLRLSRLETTLQWDRNGTIMLMLMRLYCTVTYSYPWKEKNLEMESGAAMHDPC